MINNIKDTTNINRERNLKILEQRRTFKNYIPSKKPKHSEKMIADY
jgi:hypothetical protein